MTVRNDLLVSKQKNNNPFAPAATNLSGVQTTQPKFSGLSIWTSQNTAHKTSTSFKGQSIWDQAKKHTTTTHKSTSTNQKDTEKAAKGKASAEKQKGAAAQVQGKGTTASANAQTSDINNRGSNTDSITRSAQSSNNKSMQEIQGDTSRINMLNGQIRANQKQENSLQRQRANTQARLDMLLGGTSSNSASAVKPESDAAGSGNAANAKGNKTQNTNNNQNKNTQDANNADNTAENKFNSEVYSLDTESDRLAKQQKGESTNAQRNAQQANGHKPQNEAHKFDKKHGQEQLNKMHGHGSNNRKSDMDKLDPEKRAEAERLMAELATKDQQIQSKTQQRYRFLSNKSNTYNQAQSVNQRQNQVLNRANSNADGTKQTAIEVLGVAQMLHTAAVAVKTVGIGVTAAGEAILPTPYVGEIIGPPVIQVGHITQHVGEIACNATSVLSKAAGLVKAAVIGDMRAIGMAVVQMTGVMDTASAANAGEAVQGAGSNLTSAVGDNMVSRALNEVGEVIKDTGKLVEDTVKTATDVVKDVAQGANDIVKDVIGVDVIGTVKEAVSEGKAIYNGVKAGENLASGMKNGNSPSFGLMVATADDIDSLVKKVLANPKEILSIPADKRDQVAQKVKQEKAGILDNNNNPIVNDYAYAA